MSQAVVAPFETNGSRPGEESEVQLKWAALLIVMVIIPTIGGNILVILAVSLERKLQNATNYFLMSLAVADLLVGLLVMPIALVTVFYNTGWPLPEFLCPIWLFLDVLFSTASIMHLCAISLDRYIAIKKPIQHSQYKSRAKALVKIALVWLISICIAIPIPIKGLRNYHLPNNITFNSNHTCMLKTDTFREFIMFGSLAAFFIPLTIMMVIYLLTVQVLRKKVYLLRSKVTQRVSTVFQREQGGTSPQAEQLNMLDNRLPRIQEKSNADSTNSPPGGEMSFRRMSTMGKKSMQTLSNEQRASKVLGIVFLLFVVMWCPFFITNITSVLCTSCDVNVVARLMEIFVWVGYVSSGINPLVYTLFNKTFRQAFARYITCNYKNCAGDGPGSHQRASNADRPLTRISFKSSMAENSKLFMKHGMKNGIGAVSYQSPLRCRQTPAQSASGVVLDTMILTENEGGKYEEHVSCV
ncbi:5-hydroxytryptamine receptor 2B isoform X1 [Scophthalmus maximus]|uniref:5-hydroxytryptamine receptor 2B isoform X1 n=1 Tax=Scophthalmus maximus TaxID=52904 RepID=UPI001FA8225D|nr:5-hydroxytryptamine receptor 2B isoform X1 [Scophthalmus maximus]XP_035503402.2 5-hydroxytryptamine receptor 2B isoform X1 [Scophthalmus maximus]